MDPIIQHALSNMNKQAAEETHAQGGGMDPNALSNMNKQAAEGTPAQGKGMGAAMGMNIASQGLNFISSLTPQDNDDGIGMSHKASKITSGISTGLDAAASMTSSVPIVGAAIGGVSDLFKMIKGALHNKRENDRSITSRLAKKEYDPTQDNVGYSFGNGTAKYGMPLYGNGGQPVYVTDPNDPRLKGKPLPDFLTQEVPTMNGKKIYKRKDTNSPWIEQYALGGDPQEDINYQKWRATLPKNLQYEGDYDLKGFYKENPTFNVSDPKQHLTDKFKLPNHPTFSIESKYYKEGMPAGKWDGNTYIPINRQPNNITRPGGLIESSQFALGGDPRAQADIEAEKDEAMRHTSDKVENIGGKTHPNGGTPIEVQPEHKYIYSDSIGADKNGNITLNEKDVVKSFADDAKGIQRKYSKREGDPIVDATKKFELDSLQQKAEQARVAKEQIEMGKQMKKYKAKYGANLKRFDNSGNPQPSSTQPSSIMTPEEMKKMYDDLQLKAAEVTGGLNQTITDLQQTSKQLDNTNQQLQQSSTSPTKPTPQPLFGGGHRTDPFVGPRVPSRRDNLREAAHFYTPGPDAVKKNGFFGDLTTGDKMQLASMLPAFGFNMGMGLRKADVEPNRKNLYEKDVVNIMQNRKFDIQNYLNQSNLATNTAKEDIGNNSTSVGGKMANLQKLFANQSNALGDITTKGQEMNNQYRAEEANTKNIIGEANRAESIRAAGINDQNKARKQQFLAKAFEQMGQGIATTGQSANQSLTNKLLIKSLSEISPDFDVKNMKDLQVGDDGYIVFKGVKTEFKMSDEGKIVMAGGTPNTANAAKSQYAPKEFTMKAFPNFTKTKTKK